jgi:hypothetical protein
MRPAPTNPPTPPTKTESTVPTASVFETTTPILTWPTSGAVDSGGDDDAGVSEAGIEIRVQLNRTQSLQEGWV